MIKEAIEKILCLADPVFALVNGKTYIRPPFVPAMTAFPEAIQINNLTGLVDYVRDVKIEVWNLFFAHVRDYNKVLLYSGMSGDFNQRPVVIESISRPCLFKFGHFMDIESFIIQLNAGFLQSAERDELVRFVSGVKFDNQSRIEDNGVSQTLKAKQGVSSLIKDIPVKNIVRLAPYRTFNEIGQPESEFLFRFSHNDGQPLCGLFEADGEAWKQSAIQSIKAHLKANLEIPVIA